MTLLQERLPDFPENPGDGFQIQEPLPDGGFVLWTYNEQFNQWTYETFTNVINGYVYTDQVLTRTEASPVPTLLNSADEVPEIRNQKDVNHFLANNLGGAIDDGLVVRVEELEADQERQDKDLEDYKAEVLTDQQRQDKELSDYKTLIAKQQQDQDKAISDEQSARADADAAHDAQLSTLEYKLDTVVGLQFKGLYTFKHDADCDAAYLDCLAAAGGDPTAQSQCNKDLVACNNGKAAAGTFEAVDPDDRFDHLEAIIIHKNSKDGQELEWDSILKAGDYLEIDHKAADSLDKQNYGLYRLKADPAEATNADGEPVYDLELEFLQGSGDLVESQDYEIRGITADQGINPEELGDFLLKEEAAATYLPLSGGRLTGNLLSNALYKTTRNTGYAFQVRPNDGDTSAFIHTDGHGSFTNRVEVDGVNLSKEGHSHAWSSITGKPSTYPPENHSHNYALSNHNHDSSYVKGNYTITKSNGNFYIS